MKLLFPLAVLTMLGSPVYAADSISFVIGGHRIHIEAPRHCNSASCVSVSIPGIYEKLGRDRYDNDDRDVTGSAASPAPVQASIIPPAGKPAQPVVCAPPPPPVRPIAAAVQQVALQPKPQIQPLPIQPPKTVAIVLPPPAPPVIARPMPDIAPRVSKVSHEVDEEPDETPVGDWQTEGRKGMVRIEPCGQALCGYVLDPSSNAKGETVLVDMKSKAASEWSGSIYSRDSGNIYYGTIAMKGANSLRVEACALGRFFCSGNVWSRADVKPQRMISDRGMALEPRS